MTSSQKSRVITMKKKEVFEEFELAENVAYLVPCAIQVQYVQ